MAVSILVADDSSALRKSMSFVGSQEGFTLVEASGGIEFTRGVPSGATGQVVKQLSLKGRQRFEVLSGVIGQMVKSFESHRLLAAVAQLIG